MQLLILITYSLTISFDFITISVHNFIVKIDSLISRIRFVIVQLAYKIISYISLAKFKTTTSNIIYI